MFGFEGFRKKSPADIQMNRFKALNETQKAHVRAALGVTPHEHLVDDNLLKEQIHQMMNTNINGDENRAKVERALDEAEQMAA